MMAPKERERQDESLPGTTEAGPADGPPSRARKSPRRKRWYERTSVTLCVAAGMVVIAFGFIHVITGVVSPLNLPVDFVWKESFGYRETFVNANKIQRLPYLAAKIKYPLGCKALQRRDYLPSGREFEAREMGQQRENLRHWQAQFEGSLERPQRAWQDELRGKLQAASASPEEPNACNDRGMAFAREGRYEAAIAEFSRAIQRNPVFVEAFHNRALVYVAIGNLGQGVSDLSVMVEIRPECADGYDRRGRLYLAMGQYDQAIADFGKVVEIDSQRVDAYFLRALACYVKGRYEEAWEDLDRLQVLGRAVPAGFVMALHRASGHDHSQWQTPALH